MDKSGRAHALSPSNAYASLIGSSHHPWRHVNSATCLREAGLDDSWSRRISTEAPRRDIATMRQPGFLITAPRADTVAELATESGASPGVCAMLDPWGFFTHFAESNRLRRRPFQSLPSILQTMVASSSRRRTVLERRDPTRYRPRRCGYSVNRRGGEPMSRPIRECFSLFPSEHCVPSNSHGDGAAAGASPLPSASTKRALGCAAITRYVTSSDE